MHKRDRSLTTIKGPPSSIQYCNHTYLCNVPSKGLPRPPPRQIASSTAFPICWKEVQAEKRGIERHPSHQKSPPMRIVDPAGPQLRAPPTGPNRRDDRGRICNLYRTLLKIIVIDKISARIELKLTVDLGTIDHGANKIGCRVVRSHGLWCFFESTYCVFFTCERPNAINL